MKKMTFILGLAIASIIFLAPQKKICAQTLEDAGNTFNSAIQLMQNDLPSAISKFEEVIGMCEKIGESGNELKMQAQNQLPILYYNYAVNLQASQNYDQAIEACNKAIQTGQQVNNADIIAKAVNLTAQIYMVKGNEYFKNKDFANALVSFDQAITLDSTLYRAYYGKLLVYREQDKYDEMDEMLEKVKTTSTQDPQFAEKAQALVAREYSIAAAKAIQAKNSSLALTYCDKALALGDATANTYYYQTLAANMEKKYSLAAEAAQKALELEQKDKSKIYFELGKAYEGLGRAADACAAYKNVTDGPLVQNAQYQIKQVLKCK
ncbi:MAG TPA: hypothetical protein PK028_03840 [Bacteroidales bacterium]|nr:hypothetical protein [Bacteroidota bacterium]NMD16263.1 hypothetical protein [Bacteroidales bacterium]HOU34526.1 hypothetical protein [Bacteroidales bacterium]HPA28822.1 hypothetical protein [Bacteroidales bacterium]HQF17855.1 hypothetical protein [Bacteroidales bacterium]